MMISISARKSIGKIYIINLPQRNRLMEMGEDLIIQKAPPSELTAGNINRTDTAESTKAAKAIFINAI